jgi:hypothetical protein
MEPLSPFDPVPDQKSEAPSSASVQDSEPRLGIIHFMGWMAATAACLSTHQVVLRWLKGTGHAVSDPVSLSVHQVAGAIGAGLAVGFVVMMLVRRRRGFAFPSYPGEFLAILQGFLVILSYAALAALGAGVHETLGQWTITLVWGVPQCIVLTLFATWASRTLHLRRWRVFFVGFAVLTVLLFVLEYTYTLPSFLFSMSLNPAWMECGIKIAMPVLLAVALLGDRRNGADRPWTHWLGILLQAWIWFSAWILPLLLPR